MKTPYVFLAVALLAVAGCAGQPTNAANTHSTE